MSKAKLMSNKILNLENKIDFNQLVKSLPNKPIIRVSNPFKPFKSRSYGYKKIPGYVVIIGKIKKGGIEPQIPSRGRTPSKIYRKYSRDISHYDILVAKILKKYKPMHLVNGYYLGETHSHIWYEIILKDPNLIK